MTNYFVTEIHDRYDTWCLSHAISFQNVTPKASKTKIKSNNGNNYHVEASQSFQIWDLFKLCTERPTYGLYQFHFFFFQWGKVCISFERIYKLKGTVSFFPSTKQQNTSNILWKLWGSSYAPIKWGKCSIFSLAPLLNRENMELPLFNPHSCTDTKQKRRIASGYIEVHGVREHACHLSDHKIIKARAYVVLKDWPRE